MPERHLETEEEAVSRGATKTNAKHARSEDVEVEAEAEGGGGEARDQPVPRASPATHRPRGRRALSRVEARQPLNQKQSFVQFVLPLR